MSAICVNKPGSYWPMDPYTREPVRRRGRYRVRETFAGGEVDVRYTFVMDDVALGSDPERDAMRTFLRAREKVKWRVVALRADHMLTLTYRENVTDLDESRSHLRLFWKLMRRYHEDFKFVGVAEFQQRGAVHWHLALNGWHDVTLVRRLWLAVLERSGYEGNVDIKYFHGRGAGAIADYISKYLGKGFEVGERPRYSHYYVTSRGLVFDTLRYVVFGYSDEEIQAFVEDLLRERSGRVRSRWRCRGSPGVDSGGVCTW